jgi:hypothetical protein
MRSWGRLWVLAAIAPVLVAGGRALAAAAPASPARPAAARLEGFFELSGTITNALNVPGEHTGKPVRRKWAFIELCRAGACPNVKLVRGRTGGIDVLILRRHSPAFYAGGGTYYAPERCNGRRYRKGELVSFRITVRVTAAVRDGTAIVATRLRAFYNSSSRRGLTRCVSVGAHDAARYLGTSLVQTPEGAIFSDASTRLTPAS